MASYKIAFVLDDSLDSTDGVQQYVLNVGKWLTSTGHKVHYIVGETTRSDIAHIHSLGQNLKVRFNKNRMSIPLPVSKLQIAELLDKEKFDILHIQMPYSPFLAGRVIEAAGVSTGVVGTFHIAPHSRVVHMANWLLRRLVSRSLKRFDQVISVSKTAQDFASQTFGLASAVIPNTIDLQPFYKAQALDKYAHSTNIIFLGRLVERKGCQYFLKAVNRLHQQGSLPNNCRVIVCGKGPMEDKLRQYVTRHNLEQLVTFTGFVTEADKPSYLASGDLVVYPSTGGESFGIVLLEAMAASRGVVLAGNNPGYADTLSDRKEALFDPKNEAQFADKLKEYIISPTMRKQAAEWQRSFVTKFDLPNVGHQIMATYDMALHKQKG